ncbi:MAG: cation:proton antiporter [Burkholderiales bacterium]|nr:cation:proton antiporter [Burkholderiales bacterium]
MASIWFLIVGALLLFMGLGASVLQRLPLSTAMLYLLSGYLLGPAGAGLLTFDPLSRSALLEFITEIAVLISLFAVGLKLRVPFSDEIWRLSLRLGIVAMLVTIFLIAAAGMLLFDLPLGAAVLLGAIVAPTDPVLASDVQLKHAEDRDRVRASLTGEGGLNDGIAFPFVMLGIGLLGLHDLGPYGIRWLTVDLVWAIAAGLLSGWIWGRAVSRLVVRLRGKYREAIGLEEFLTLGLISLAYGFALLIHSYGFLAVFAAGAAVRRVEHTVSGANLPRAIKKPIALAEENVAAVHPATAPAYMTESLLRFNLQLERIAEVVVVVLLGSMLSAKIFDGRLLLLAALVFLVIRPLSVAVALAGANVTPLQRNLMAWFGIRGIGSVYYLAFAVERGLSAELAHRLVPLILGVVTISIVAHGISATPLMERYRAARKPIKQKN